MPIRPLMAIRAGAALAAGVLGAVAALAQAPAARVSGNTLDQVGGLLPYVNVGLTNRRSMAHREVRTDQAGHFDIEGLAPGDYLVEAERSGFATAHDGLSVEAGDERHQDITLDIAPFEERITITDGDAPRVTDPGDQSRNGAGAAGCETSAIGGNLLPPIRIREAQPEYPRRLRDAGIQGSVVVAGRISGEGVMNDLHLLTATRPDLAAASVAAIERWRWTVPRLDCVPIEASLIVTVEFRLRP